MKKLCALVISICCGIFQLSAQQNKQVLGTVIDSAKTTLPGVIVQLIADNDTIKTTTDKNGNFSFSRIRATQFSLVVSMMGYHTLNAAYTFADKEKQKRVGPLELKASVRMLDEVVIKGKPKPVRFMQDTVEYDAEAYLVQEGDNVADLLKQLPDVEVDENYRVTTMGKDMVKLRVNGKDFFTNNVQEFIAQLPAGIVSKLQIIDDFGDQANFTGIKIGEPIKMLNIVTKPGMDNGSFGKLSGRTGTNDKIGGDGNVRFWKGKKQSSAHAGMNTENNGAGNSRSMNAGFNHNDQISKNTKGGIAYNYSSSSSAFARKQVLETVYPEGNFTTRSDSKGDNSNANHNLNSNIQYNNGKVFLTSNLAGSFGHLNNQNAAFSNQYGLLRQDLKNSSGTKNSTPNLNGSFNLSRKLKNNKNQLSASGGFGLSNNSGTQQINTNTLYYDKNTGLLQKDSLLNRNLVNESGSQSGSFGFNYSIGVKKLKDSLSNRSLNFSYNASARSSWNEVSTFVIDNNSSGVSFVDSLSTSYRSRSLDQSLGLNYNYNTKSMRYNFGINVRPAFMTNHDLRLKQKFVNNTLNYSPNLNISKTLPKGKTFNAYYQGDNINPSIEQLQPTRNSQNLQNIIIGNPDLKPSFNHRLNASYNYMHAKSRITLRTGINAATTQQEIVSHVTLIPDTLNSLKQITRYENINGNYAVGGNYSVNIPVGKKYSINYSGSIGVSNRAIIFNNQKAFGKGVNFSQQLRSDVRMNKFSMDMRMAYSTSTNNDASMSRFSAIQQFGLGQISAPAFFTTTNFNVDLNGELRLKNFSLEGGGRYDKQSNDGSGDQRFRNNSNVDLNLSSRLTVWKSYFLTVYSTKRYSYGYALDNANPLLLSANFEKRFFKDKALSLSISANDLLDQGNNISRIVSGNTIIDSSSKQPTRVFFLGLSYNLSKFGGRSFPVNPD
ncbi:outer membrane beta-barrel protein [Pedobacter psychroterrae]|uniref:TonB-dependent receptor n=1 Tax=Pedobacter psychroterrae TaxID=2530453 RepID=A0A4R0NRT2_9SPHI|nr:outer membrane beta-barrel protein [Pedobacter psychroterrae]TCD03852.1 TonB-dependent receptor [Pedobacter psychroterrae]